MLTSLPSWVRAALVGMWCVTLSSGFQPFVDAVSGAFVPADIAQDAAAAGLFVDGVNPYGPAIREPHARLTGLPVAATFPHFPHPPFSLIVSLPLAFTSFQAGAALWFAFTVALVFVLAVLLSARPPAAGGGVGQVGTWPMFLLLLAWPPVLYCLEKGQWSVLLAVLIAFAWRAIRRDDLRAAAIWAAGAASVKVFPVVLGAYFLLRSVRATGWFLATGAVLTGLPLAWIGLEAFPAFMRESRLNMPYWESFPLVMFSIHGAFARLFVGGQWAEPLVYAPAAAWAIEASLVAVVLGLAARLTILARQGRADHGLAFAAWIVLLPMLNPQSLGHNGVLLAVPLVLLGGTVGRTGVGWHRWAWALSVVLVSVPKQTVWRFAAPPVGPVEGLAIAALPTWGALLLFFVTVSVARLQARRPVPSAASSGKIAALPAIAPEAAPGRSAAGS